jgi:hypothetical protein
MAVTVLRGTAAQEKRIHRFASPSNKEADYVAADSSTLFSADIRNTATQAIADTLESGHPLPRAGTCKTWNLGLTRSGA